MTESRAGVAASVARAVILGCLNVAMVNAQFWRGQRVVATALDTQHEGTHWGPKPADMGGDAFGGNKTPQASEEGEGIVLGGTARAQMRAQGRASKGT